MSDPFDDIRMQAVQSAMGTQPESAPAPAAPAAEAGGRVNDLFRQAGVSIGNFNMDTLMQLPDSEFRAALAEQVQAATPDTGVGAGAGGSAQPPSLPDTSPPPGFTIHPDDPNVIVDPEGKTYRREVVPNHADVQAPVPAGQQMPLAVGSDGAQRSISVGPHRYRALE